MAYVEIRKNGKVVTRREVDQAKAHSGICVRLGKGKRVEVAIGRPGSVGKYDVEVFEGAPGGDETLPGGPKRRDDAAASLSVQQSSAEEAFPHVEGYRITGRLGEGGMGTVWHARQLGTNRDVALKLLGKGAFASERARHRFEREVELCARLEHPCIAGIYDSGVHRGVYYYAMEHIRGVHLDQYVRQNDLSDNEVLSLMQAVCQAVQHAHQRGVIHRDLKPSNVMVSEDGRPHVLDFGLARTFQDEDKGYTISVEGEIAGTPAYMAPEQAAGRHGEMDTRTDVYTLGVILFKLLTGESPHEMTGSRYDLIRRIVEGEPRRPRDVREGLDREIESLLVKAMAKDPAERYASAGDLAADIGNYLSGDPLRARPATTWYFLRKRVRKYRGRVALAAALAVALIGVAVWAYVRVAQERDRAEAARIVAGQERDRAEQQRARAEGEQARAEREKTRAEQEKTRAEREKAGAVLARQKEAEQRKKAEAALRTAQEESYYNTIALAAKKIDDRAYDQARALLAGTQPEIRSWEWGRLAFLCRRDVMTFTPPAGAIVGLAPAQGGGFRVAVTKIITKWAGRGVNRHKETVAHELAVFDPASGKSLWTRRIEESYRPYARLSPAGQFLVRSWPIVTFWHADTGQQKKQFDQPAVYQVGAISPDGSRLLARVRPAVYKNMDRRSSPLSVVDTGSGAVLCTFDKLKSFHFRDAAFSPKGRKVLLLINQSVRRSSKTHYWSLAEIYDTSTGRLARAIPRQNDLAQNGAWSPDGQSVAATVGTRIVVWNAETGREVKAFDYPQGRPYRLAFSPDSRSLAVSGADAVVRLYDVASGSEVRRFEGHTDGILNLAFSRDGSQLATASNNVANSHTNGYKKSRAVLEEGQNGEVGVSIEKIDTPGVPVSYPDGVDGSIRVEETSNVDLAEETVNMIMDQRGFEANLKSVKTQEELEEAILDILA